jgi:ribosomal protein S18 acetylase RimI-like enzyme
VEGQAAEEVVALVNAAALAGEDDLVTRDALIAELTAPTYDPARDFRAWRDAAGALRAFARVRIEPVRGEHHGRLHYAIARADDAALEPEVIAWAAARLREAAPAPRRLVHAVGPRDAARAGRLAALGFTPYRRRSALGRAIAPLPDVPLAPGFTIRPCHGVGDAAGYVAAFNEAFADTLDFSPLSIDEWTHDTLAPGYKRDLDLVVEAPDGTIVGFCYATLDDDQPSLGCIAAIGVCRAYRRAGLAASLLARALGALAAAGATSAHLHVDDDSPTGAPRLYARLGFALRRREVRYAISVG